MGFALDNASTVFCTIRICGQSQIIIVLGKYVALEQ